MYYILFDKIDGTILGLDNELTEHNKGLDWFNTDEEVYKFIGSNNGKYKINLNKVKDDTITMDMLINIRDTETISDIIENMQSKNKDYCRMYIENGCEFILDNGESKWYTYKETDQLNIEQIHNMIVSNIIKENAIIPIKFHEEVEYTNLSINEFNRLYKTLASHKLYQLFYLKEYNDYLETVTDKNRLSRLTYEIGLPEDKRNEIEEKINNMLGGDN